jgi:hypothetical protein
MDEYPKRNLVKEEISVFLENHSQNGRTFGNGSNMLEVELRKWMRRLDESDASVREFLEMEMGEGEDIRNEEIRKLMGVLSKKLSSESTR